MFKNEISLRNQTALEGYGRLDSWDIFIPSDLNGCRRDTWFLSGCYEYEKDSVINPLFDYTRIYQLPMVAYFLKVRDRPQYRFYEFVKQL